MATVHVTHYLVRDAAVGGLVMPCPASVPNGADTVTSSGTSAQADITTTSPEGFWRVTAKDGDVFAAFGENPTAASGVGWLVLSGTSQDFGVSTTGEKCAVVDA